MAGRTGAAVAAVLALGSSFGVSAQHLQLTPLPYDYADLEPHISADIMRVHHLGHQAAYMEKTNAILSELRSQESTKPLAKAGLDYILGHLSVVPPQWRTAFRNNAGGFVNHDIYWSMMAPANGTSGRGGGSFDLSLPFGEVVTAVFHDEAGFKKAITDEALGLFGSGWVWLSVDIGAPGGALVLQTTQNQDSPAMQSGRVPIFALDVWEHAYYLQHKNKRAAYVESFWRVFNFAELNRRYVVAVAEGGLTGPVTTLRVERLQPTEVEPSPLKRLVAQGSTEGIPADRVEL